MIQAGSKVKYARGVKELLIGRVGVVQDVEDEIAMVLFDVDFVSPCWLPNLDEVEDSRGESG